MAVISYVHFFAEVAPRLHQVNAHAMWLTDTTFCSHQIDGAKTSVTLMEINIEPSTKLG